MVGILLLFMVHYFILFIYSIGLLLYCLLLSTMYFTVVHNSILHVSCTPLLPTCAPWPHFDMTWEIVRNADPYSPSWLAESEPAFPPRSPGDYCAHWSLRSTVSSIRPAPHHADGSYQSPHTVHSLALKPSPIFCFWPYGLFFFMWPHCLYMESDTTSGALTFSSLPTQDVDFFSGSTTKSSKDGYKKARELREEQNPF